MIEKPLTPLASLTAIPLAASAVAFTFAASPAPHRGVLHRLGPVRRPWRWTPRPSAR